jgi:outer membrane immunogenic protein
MKKVLQGLVATAALASAPAIAADMPVKAYSPPPPMVTSWTGCYIGAGFGYGWWNREHADYDTTTGVALSVNSTVGGRGWLGTGQLGCDYQFAGHWVIGGFVDGNIESIKGNYNLTNFTRTGTLKESSSWAFGGRLGYEVMPGLLSFVSGGWTQARFDGVTFTNNLGVTVTDALASRTCNGWFIGGGTEYSIGFLPGLYWKNEYRFSSYSNSSNAILTPSIGTVGDRSQLYSQTIRSELVWRFGGQAPACAKY